MRPVDTANKAETAQLEVFKRLGPEGRLRASLQLSQTSRMLLSDGVQRRHPEYNEREIRLATISLILPKKLFLAAYPEAPNILP